MFLQALTLVAALGTSLPAVALDATSAAAAPSAAPSAAAAAPTPSPAAAPSASPAPAAPSTSPASSTSPAPTPAPTPTATPTTSAFGYVVTPPAPQPGLPVVHEIDLTDRTAHPGKPFTIVVSASPDVTAVTVEALGERFALYVMGGGRFGATWHEIPAVPPDFLNRSYTATITASTSDGRQTSVPITLRLAP